MSNSYLEQQGVELERSAVSTLGSVISDWGRNNTSDDSYSSRAVESAANVVRSGGNLDNLTSYSKNIASDFATETVWGGAGIWQSPKYAEALVKYAPKTRFIFKVEFVFEGPYNKFNREFMYVVKNIDKPKVTFDYEEINMYNFKTKVLRAIRHEPLNMVFHDDIQNKVLDFFNMYRNFYSPISNLDHNQKHMFEESGMQFEKPGSNKHGSASMGVLLNDTKTVLSHIVLTQVYAHGSRQNKFIFVNPKIEQFDFDNVDHDSSDPNALSVTFNYDSLYVSDSYSGGTPGPIVPGNDILGAAERAKRFVLGNKIGENSSPIGETANTNTSDNSVWQGEYDEGRDFINEVTVSINSNESKNTKNKLIKGTNQSTAGLSTMNKPTYRNT